MIKIAIVSSSFPPLSAGGVSSAQFGLLSLLRNNKSYEVKGFTFADNNRSTTDGNYIFRSGTNLLFQWVIRKIIYIVFKLLDRGKQNYQTIDIFVSSIGSLKAAFKIKKFSPDIVMVSDHGAPMFFIMPFVKAKYIWIAHHNPMRFVSNPIIGKMSIKDASFATSIEKKCINNCSCVISPSKYMADFLKESHDVKINSFVVPNLADVHLLNNVEKREHPSCSTEEFKIFIPSAGSIIKGERYIYCILHWISSALPNRKIVFLLSGHMSDQLAYELSHQKNIKYIVLGQLAYSDNIAFLKSCDLCISPTLLENFGMAILEAVLSGIPVVSFDVGGNREIIKNGENGYLVDYMDISELCNKAIKLIIEPLPKETVMLNTKKIYSIKDIEEKVFNIIEKTVSEVNF